MKQLLFLLFAFIPATIFSQSLDLKVPDGSVVIWKLKGDKQFKIVQVVNENEAIISITESYWGRTSGSTKMGWQTSDPEWFYFVGDTKGMVDGTILPKMRNVKRTGTKQYSTVAGGTKTLIATAELTDADYRAMGAIKFSGKKFPETWVTIKSFKGGKVEVNAVASDASAKVSFSKLSDASKIAVKKWRDDQKKKAAEEKARKKNKSKDGE